MKAMLANAANVASLAASSSPEDFARRFKAIATQALAKAIVDGLDEAVGATVSTFAANPAIAGWEKLVGGLIGNFTWDRSIDDPTPMVSISAYEPRSATALATFGITWSAGVSIGGSF